MADKQSSFLGEFKEAFHEYFGKSSVWSGGQATINTAGFINGAGGSRPAGRKKREQFELGDAVTMLNGRMLIIEFESGQLSISNLLKFWPYMRGELTSEPVGPIIFCHFSNWWSYATQRDLWEWTLSHMQVDPGRKVDIHGRQFDHWKDDKPQRANSLSSAMQWIASVAGPPSPIG